MEDIMNKIYNYSLEEIMGERFGSYSKYIIQDRAIPDVRDGLKPVQRRILFSMYKEHNTFDKPYKKSKIDEIRESRRLTQGSSPIFMDIHFFIKNKPLLQYVHFPNHSKI